MFGSVDDISSNRHARKNKRRSSASDTILVSNLNIARVLGMKKIETGIMVICLTYVVERI